MNWILLSILSALLLGFYDSAKKTAVDRNAVPAVLMASVSCGAVIWAIGLTAGRVFGSLENSFIHIDPISWPEHGMILIKSVIVATSWTLAYFSLKRLPLSVAAPLRATGPVWTIVMATLFLGERPSSLQWLGIIFVVAAFFRFSTIGRTEGIHFRRSVAVWWMIGATIVGAISGLYDKYLLHHVGLPAATVQAWFTIDLVPVMFPVFAYWYVRDRTKTPFQWRRSIPAIAILLLVADYAYFVALSHPDALVSVVSPIRRLAVIVSLAFGLIHLKEKQPMKKAVCVAAVISGVVLISLGS